MKLSEHRHEIGKTPEEKAKQITELVNREIKWNVVKQFEDKGKLLTCEICGNEGYGGYWCRPCIHGAWCCECCVLLGVPNYYTATYVLQ